MPRARAACAASAASAAAAPETTEHEIVAVTPAHAAFEQLYRETADRVYGLCLRLSGDRRRAAALAQDVFVRAWRERRRQPEWHRAAEEPRAWVWRLAVEVALGADRLSARRQGAPPAPEAEPLDAEAAAAASPRRRDLTAALRRLPAGARAAFVLHDVEGCGDAETAALLGVTPPVAREQRQLARTLLCSAGPLSAIHAPHLTHDELGELLDRLLDDADYGRALRHVAECAPCRARHDALVALLAAARASRSAVTVPPDLWTLVSASTVYAPLLRRHLTPSVRVARVLGGVLLVLGSAAATAWLLLRHPAF